MRRIVEVLLCCSLCGFFSCESDEKQADGGSGSAAGADAGLASDVPVEAKSLSSDELTALDDSIEVTGATKHEGDLPPESKDADAHLEIATYEQSKAAYGEQDTAVEYEVEAQGAEKVEGTYVKVEGSSSYYEVPVTQTKAALRSAHNLLMRLPRVRENGRFCLVYSAYTDAGIVSRRARTCVVVPRTNGDDVVFVTKTCAGLARCFDIDELRCRARVTSRVAGVRAFQSQCVRPLAAAGVCLAGLTRCPELSMLRDPPADLSMFRCGAELTALDRCTRSNGRLGF